MSSVTPANANYSNANGTETHEAPDSSYLQISQVEEINLTQEPELEAPDPSIMWSHPSDSMYSTPASGGSSGGGGGAPESAPPPATGSDGVDAPPPAEQGTVAGVEFGVSAQVFLGFSAKVGFVGGKDGTGLTLGIAGRAGWAFGVSAGASGTVTPGAKGIESVGGPSVGVVAEGVIASAGASQSLGNSGPEGPTTYSVSPPGAGVGVMVGVTSELGYTVVIPGPKTDAEWEAVMRVMN